MVKCPICEGELVCGGPSPYPGVTTREAACVFCGGAWAIVFVYVGSRDDRTEVRPDDKRTQERLAAFKRGRAIAAARNAEHLINIGLDRSGAVGAGHDSLLAHDTRGEIVQSSSTRSDVRRDHIESEIDTDTRRAHLIRVGCTTG